MSTSSTNPSLLPLLDADLSLVSGGTDKRSGLELAYDRGKACALGAVAAQAVPAPVPPHIKAGFGCVAGVAEQVRQEGGMNLGQKKQ